MRALTLISKVLLAALYRQLVETVPLNMQQVGDGVPPGVGVPPGLGEGDGDIGVGVGEGAAGLTLIMEGAGGSSYCSSGAVGRGLCCPV